MRLYKHQAEAYILAQKQNLALFHECGCGKTLTALKIIEYHRDRLGNKWRGALVVCPLSIIESAWLEDCRRFTPHLSAVNLWGRNPRERIRRLNEQHDIYLVNFETFKTLLPEIQARALDVLVVDESSKMKSPDSQTTRALLALAGVRSRGKGMKYPVEWIIPYRYILSGTPAPNDRTEYWSQITFIAPGRAFSENYYSFRGRYFVPRPLGRTGINLWDYTKDPTLREEFNQRMAPWCHVVCKADAADLPEQVHEIRKVQLSMAERKSYEIFRDELVLRFASEDVLASTALAEIMKARQLTSGFCYGSKGIHQTGKSKLKELLSLLEEIGVSSGHHYDAGKKDRAETTGTIAAHPADSEKRETQKSVIIWCNFRHEMAEILQAIPSAGALWSGSVDREKVIRGFKNGQFPILAANPQSAGHGLTFTHCCDAIYFSLNYSWELQKQSQDRIHRIGQNRKCTYYYLIAQDTIDEVIYRTVARKQRISEDVLHYLKSTKTK